jgi:hypothetical protein
MIVAKRTIRKANQDDISAISAFDSEGTGTGCKELKHPEFKNGT